jgi:eukaryotic-like serine/threonine-protein kinase
VTSILPERWREISAWLDDALDLSADARRAWLQDLEARDPAAAAQVRAYLEMIQQLDEQNFLGVPAAEVLDASLKGRQFGAYTLEREIGHGGTGTVWLAHRSDGRFAGQAAVKLLNPALVGHPSARRFAREGHVLARLQHPNIAHLLDAGISDGSQPYLILEYVRGERIDDYCESRSLDVRERIRLFLDVLGAVAHAQSRLIVHRDLKPSNILVTDDGVVKLLDFGVAALLAPQIETSTLVTRHLLPGLTPGFAAPEQLLGEPATTATDVYSLGIVLCRLLAGRNPLAPEDRSTAELVRVTLDHDAPHASDIATNDEIARELRGDLDNIIAMALRRNPLERYATADQFAQDLQRFLDYEPVAARRRSPLYLARMFARRHRAAVVAVFAMALTLVGAVILTTGQMIEAARQRDRVVFESRQARASKDFLELLMLSDLGTQHPMRTLPERIETGVRVLETGYGDDPTFRGRMLAEFGNALTENEERQRANELFEKAYAIGKAEGDAELMAYAQCSRAYGDGYADVRADMTERLDEAERLLSRMDAPHSELTAMCLIARSKIEQRLGRGPEAEALLLRAKRLLEEDRSTHLQIYVNVLVELCGIYIGRNQPLELLRMAELGGAMLDRNGRALTLDRLQMRQRVTTALYAMGEVRAAVEESDIIMARMREIASQDDAPISMDVHYATLQSRMRRPDAVLRILEPTLERARNSGHAGVLYYVLYIRGDALVQLERWAEAEAALKEGASLAAAGFGNRNVGAYIASVLARMELARGAVQSARQHADRALELAGYRTNKPERGLARILLVAADVALSEGKAADAERMARDSLALSEPNARALDSSADVGEALLRLARARIAARAPAEARSLLERAVLCLTNGFGADHVVTVEARQTLSEINARNERWNPRLQTDGPRSVRGSTKRSI